MAINWIESKDKDQIKWTYNLVSNRFQKNFHTYTAAQYTKNDQNIQTTITNQ